MSTYDKDQSESTERASVNKNANAANANAGSVSRRAFVASGISLGSLVVLAGCSSASNENAGSDADSASDEKILRIGMEAANAPYNWQTDTETEYTIPIQDIDGAYADGYDVSVSKIVAEELSREPIAVKLAWSGLIEAVNNGSIDLIIAGMTATDERRESIDFTEPYIVDSFGLLVRADSEFASATSLADFAGAAVLGQKDTLLDDVIDEIPGVNHLAPADSVPSCITALKNSTCDAIVYNELSREGYLASNPDLVAIDFAEGEGFSEDEPCSIGLAKGQDDFLAQLDEIIAGISQEERDALWAEAVERQPE